MTTRKTLAFAGDLHPVVTSGQRHITIRKYRAGAHDFVTGEIIDGVFAGHEKPVALRIIGDTDIRMAGEVSPPYCRADGFRSRREMIEQMKRYYPGFNDETEVGLVFFELADQAA